MPRSRNYYFALAAAWLLITTILLCLPGNKLPQPPNNWLERLHADKWVHIFIFALLAWLWCKAATIHLPATVWPKRLLTVAILCCIYGIVMEFVQKWLIPARGFEALDITADAAGCAIGWWLTARSSSANKRS